MKVLLVLCLAVWSLSMVKASWVIVDVATYKIGIDAYLKR